MDSLNADSDSDIIDDRWRQVKEYDDKAHIFAEHVMSDFVFLSPSRYLIRNQNIIRKIRKSTKFCIYFMYSN